MLYIIFLGIVGLNYKVVIIIGMIILGILLLSVNVEKLKIDDIN